MSETPGAGVVELHFDEYQKPYLTVTDFHHALLPRTDEQTGELVGVELWLSHPAWPAALRLLCGRLFAVELGAGILALVDSHDKPDDGPNGQERG